MSISLTVRYSGPEQSAVPLDNYGLKAEVTVAVDMPAKIFVFQRRVPSATDPQANAQQDIFIGVADPVALEAYPEDVPDLPNEMPYYRSRMVTLVFRSMQELDEVRGLIDDDCRHLVEALKMLAILPAQEDVTYD